MMSEFFHFQHTLSRLFNNCIKFSWSWISSSWNMKGGSIWPPLLPRKTNRVLIFTAQKVSVFGVTLVRMRENTDQNNTEQRHFSRNDSCFMIEFVLFTTKLKSMRNLCVELYKYTVSIHFLLQKYLNLEKQTDL